MNLQIGQKIWVYFFPEPRELVIEKLLLDKNCVAAKYGKLVLIIYLLKVCLTEKDCLARQIQINEEDIKVLIKQNEEFKKDIDAIEKGYRL